MKKLIILLLVVFASDNLFSQTNVFPTTGNVGIGTATPSANLHIPGDGATIGQSNLNNSYLLVGSNTNGIGFDNNEIFNKGGSLYFGTGDSFPVYFRTNKITALTIDKNQRVGIGTNTVNGNLQIGHSTQQGMICLGGGKGYSGIGSTRSDGGLVLGKNIYARYQDASDNSIARVGVTSERGFSGIKFNQHGGIDLFGKSGTVIADQIANREENVKLRINGVGNVGIGTTNPKYKLDVLGTIRARELKVDMQGADFVFEENYPLRPISELEDFVKANKHLPEIASAKEMQANGVNQSEMNQKLLQKIEELTLYVIDLNRKVGELQIENEELRRKDKE